MPDREKVIKGLSCIKGDLVFCVDCAYSDGNGDCTFSCKACCADDAIALLKEQEARIEQLNRFVNGFSREAVPVVRCKDCINCVKEPNGELYCDILAVGYEPLGSKKVNGDWFCADGKRKKDR